MRSAEGSETVWSACRRVVITVSTAITDFLFANRHYSGQIGSSSEARPLTSGRVAICCLVELDDASLRPHRGYDIDAA